MPLVILLLPSKEISVFESRYLKRFPNFAVNKFFSGEFQSNLDLALADQFALGETLKRNYNISISSIENSTFKLLTQVLNADTLIPRGKKCFSI